MSKASYGKKLQEFK